MSEARVWIRARKGKRRTTYDLRWNDPQTGGARSKAVGGDRRVAEREAARLQDKLEAGTYRSVKRIDWATFVEEHLSTYAVASTANIVRLSLDGFGDIIKPRGPHAIRYAAFETYIAEMKRQGFSPNTINVRLRYLTAAFTRAVKRGYLGVNPFSADLYLPVEQKAPRALSNAEERAILDATERLCGFRWWALIHTMLATGGRRGEMCGLTWDRIHLDGDDPSLTFVETKNHRHRTVPLSANTVDTLRRVKMQRLREAGPFMGCYGAWFEHWERIRNAAGLPDVKGHSLRKTFITRLVRSGVPLPTVSRLAGVGVNLLVSTYNAVGMDDARDAIRRLQREAG